jgi:hypothetical protein
MIKSRFAKNPQMTIFGCENAAKRFHFSKSKFFCWSYGGQKWSQIKIDHFTKNGQKWSILRIFIGERPKMMRIVFSTRF